MSNLKKRRSGAITLVVLSSLIVSCTEEATKKEIPTSTQKVYMRADSTAVFTDNSAKVAVQDPNTVHHYHNGGMSTTDALLMYTLFNNTGGGYGYHSNGISHASNVGNNKSKASNLSGTTSSYSAPGYSKTTSSSKSSTTSRGGFGGSSFKSSAS